MWCHACSWDVIGDLTPNSVTQIRTSVTLFTSRDLTWSSGRLTRQHVSHISVVAHISWGVTNVSSAIDLGRRYWILHPVSCHTPEAVTTVFKCSWGWTQKASETWRAWLQLLINILPSCITLVLYIYYPCHAKERDTKSYTFSLILGATSKFWVTRRRFHTEAPQLVPINELLVVPWCVRTCIERMRVPTPCDAPAVLPFPWFI